MYETASLGRGFQRPPLDDLQADSVKRRRAALARRPAQPKARKDELIAEAKALLQRAELTGHDDLNLADAARFASILRELDAINLHGSQTGPRWVSRRARLNQAEDEALEQEVSLIKRKRRYIRKTFANRGWPRL